MNFYGFAYPATGVYDISRARDELGYKPEYDLEKGIADYLAALKQMKARPELAEPESREYEFSALQSEGLHAADA